MNPLTSLLVSWLVTAIVGQPRPRRPTAAQLDDENFDRMEFVRNEGRHSGIHTFEKRTFSTIPRQFECYSCMSLSYQDNWDHLKLMYTSPKVFTNRCNDPFLQRNLPTVLCASYCASLLEPNVEGGVFLGYKYIRGCVDRILRHGFNQSALRTHRFNQVDQCRSLPRAQLFNPPRGVDMPVFGDVQLCSCYGDKCNGASGSSGFDHSLVPCIAWYLFAFTWIYFFADPR